MSIPHPTFHLGNKGTLSSQGSATKEQYNSKAIRNLDEKTFHVAASFQFTSGSCLGVPTDNVLPCLLIT